MALLCVRLAVKTKSALAMMIATVHPQLPLLWSTIFILSFGKDHIQHSVPVLNVIYSPRSNNDEPYILAQELQILRDDWHSSANWYRLPLLYVFLGYQQQDFKRLCLIGTAFAPFWCCWSSCGRIIGGREPNLASFKEWKNKNLWRVRPYQTWATN